MKVLLLCLACCFAQMDTMQERPLVHLKPKGSQIDASLGGKILELMNAPALILLPKHPPKRDTQGGPWLVEVKNLGPRAVTILGDRGFTVQVAVGRTVEISSNGEIYSLKH